MIGLLGTVAGAAALELKRLQKRGSVEELRETKKRERELRQLLDATNRELEKVRLHSEAADERASQLEAKAVSLENQKEQLEQRTAELDHQKDQLQQNNSKLILTNLMLLNKTKVLEDHSRALVAKQEDLQHQLEQLQRERIAAEASFEDSLQALKEQVTQVLNRYFTKDIDLQQAIGEMQEMGIEVVPVEDMSRPSGDALEFETKLVLDSPHRMQRLMGLHMTPQLTSGLPHDSEITRLAQMTFPLGIGKDPTTGAPRITLGWRTDSQGPGALSSRQSTAGDAKQQQLLDQSEAGSSKQAPLAIKDTCSSDNSKSSPLTASIKAPVVQEGPAGAALTFSSPQKSKQSSGTFSLPSFRMGLRSSNSNAVRNAPIAKGAVPALFGSGAIKGDQYEDTITTSSKDLIRR